MSVAPGLRGKYFSIVFQPLELQQRDRICVCFEGSYPLIKFFGKNECLQRPEFIEIFLVKWDSDFDRTIDEELPLARVYIADWGEHTLSLEVKPKTPLELSNKLDQKGIYSSCFFYVIKIMTFDMKGGYDLLDSITTTTFRTVSHSKMCAVSRRGRRVIKKVTLRKKKVSHRDDSPLRGSESPSLDQFSSDFFRELGSLELPLELF